MNHHKKYLDAAIEQALISRFEGGIPIGSVLVDIKLGKIISAGHNQRVQTGDPTAHAEIDCVRKAGRIKNWHNLTLYSTLSPCPMCSGMAVLYKIPTVVAGENITFMGAEQWMRANGIEVIVMNDHRCIELMENFIAKEPHLWNEDIGIPE